MRNLRHVRLSRLAPAGPAGPGWPPAGPQQEQRIPINGRHKGILSGREYDGAVILAPQDADLVPLAGK